MGLEFHLVGHFYSLCSIFVPTFLVDTKCLELSVVGVLVSLLLHLVFLDIGVGFFKFCKLM